MLSDAPLLPHPTVAKSEQETAVMNMRGGLEATQWLPPASTLHERACRHAPLQADYERVDSRSRISVSRDSVLVGGGDGGASFRVSLDIAFTTQKIAKEMITKLMIVFTNTPTLTVGAPAFCAASSEA